MVTLVSWNQSCLGTEASLPFHLSTVAVILYFKFYFVTKICQVSLTDSQFLLINLHEIHLLQRLQILAVLMQVSLILILKPIMVSLSKS